MMTLQEILNAKEGHHFEFKEAKNKFGTKEAAEYLCAIANHGGGRLVLGVTDKRPRKVVGSNAFAQPEDAIMYFLDKLRVRCDFEIYHDENGKRVLVFEVAGRPVGLPVQFDGMAWWRDAERLVPMPESVRRAIYTESGHDFQVIFAPRFQLPIWTKRQSPSSAENGKTTQATNALQACLTNNCCLIAAQ